MLKRQLILIIFIIISNTTFAACFPEFIDYSLEAEIEKSSFIVVATPTEQRWIDDKEEPDFYSGSTYKLNVTEVLKGANQLEIELYDPNNSGRFAPEIGEQYLMFLIKTENGYSADYCGNSGKLKDKQELVETLKALLPSTTILAECEWSKSEPVRNLRSVEVAYCGNLNALRINRKITLRVNFDIIRPSLDCPECNFVYAKQSPLKDLIYLYVQNDRYQRNGWIIDLKNPDHTYFIDDSNPKGRHYKAEFITASTLKITHAGMGYKTEELYVLSDKKWVKK